MKSVDKIKLVYLDIVKKSHTYKRFIIYRYLLERLFITKQKNTIKSRLYTICQTTNNLIDTLSQFFPNWEKQTMIRPIL